MRVAACLNTAKPNLKLGGPWTSVHFFDMIYQSISLRKFKQWAMKLPNSENAYVPESKLSDYLLSEKHAVGKAKAKYFRSLGYTVKNVKRLQADLLVIVK